MFNRCKIYWRRLNDKAMVPTKRAEDAGFDIYTIEEDITVPAHSQHLFSTGLAAAVTRGWWLKVEDRGSTGSKGLHCHCGIVDNGYRGEIFICIKNDNAYDVVFTDKEEPGFKSAGEKKYLVYPTAKAIAQLIPIKQPKVISKEADEEEWAKLSNTQRGGGKLGSSGK